MELVEAKRRTRDRRTEQQLSDEFMMMVVTTIRMNGTRTKDQQVKGVRDKMRYKILIARERERRVEKSNGKRRERIK